MEYRGLTIIENNKQLLLDIEADGGSRTIYLSVKDWGDTLHFTVYFCYNNELKTLLQFSISAITYKDSNKDYMECVMYVFKYNGLKPSQIYMIL